MKKVILILIIFLCTTQVFSQELEKQRAPLFDEGNIIVGAKLTMLQVYKSSIGFITGAEYGFKGNFLNIGEKQGTLGFGLTFSYSTFKKGDWDYSNIILLGGAYYHTDIFNNPKIDPYVFLNFGYNFGGVDGAPPSKPAHGGIELDTGIGARYYFYQKFAATAEVGIGDGIFRIGIDYKIK